MAIITVAFLGFVAEINNPPIFAEDIIMVIPEEESFPEEPYTFYYQYSPIYDVTYNPNADINATNENKYKYQIKFRGSDEFKLFFNEINELELNTHPWSSHGECETQELSYYMNTSRQNFVSVNEEGIINFKIYDDNGLEEVLVSTRDGTNIKIFIQITW